MLEAQPDVLGAVHSVRYARIVRRSIHLTPFGEDFCRVTFALEAAGRSGPLPEHSSPPQARREAAPPAVPGES